jgi:Uma2 family endonuclease
MSISRPDLPFTYDEYKALAASTDERHELIDGELSMVPAPTVAHQVVSKNLGFLLEQHVRASGCGRVLHAPLDVVLGTGAQRSVVQPDVLFISNDRAAIVMEAEIVGAPDLIIEILSPRTAERDRGQKKTLYARSGVSEYWIVDSELESIEVFSLGPGGYERPVRYELGDRLASSVVPGFEAELTNAFRVL